MSARRLIPILVLALGLLATGGEARAHGGGFRMGTPDPGPVDPGSDPGGPSGPVTPPTGGLRKPYDDYEGRTGFWELWWYLNAGAWDVRRGRYLLRGRLAVTLPAHPAGGGGEDATGPELDAVRVHRLLLERARKRVVIPYLESVVRRRSGAPSKMVSAALIAWARIATERDVIRVLKGYARDEGAPDEVRESAVYGLGLLRRSGDEPLLDAATAADVRDFLLAFIDDVSRPHRARAFAPYSLALLADQPYAEDAWARDGRSVTRALWTRILKPRTDPELSVGLLVAIGKQPPRGVPDGVRQGLRRLALVGSETLGWGPREQSHAIHAYARLGAPDAPLILRRMACASVCDGGEVVRSASLVALAEIAPTLSSKERADAATWLLAVLPETEDPRVRGTAFIALGALLGADLRAGDTTVLEDTEAAKFLVRTVKERKRGRRSYPPLALAIAARSDRPDSRPAAVFRTEAAGVLARAVEHARGTDDDIAPCIAAAGLARVEAARPALLEILANHHRMPRLRGHAARALGVLGRPDGKTIEVLLEATRDRIHPFVQAQATWALGLVAAPGACDELLDQLDGDPTRGAMVAVALALGRLGDPKAADRLVALAKNEKAGLYVRATAIVSLGLILDPEAPPSAQRLRTHANLFGLTWSHRKVLDIL